MHSSGSSDLIASVGRFVREVALLGLFGGIQIIFRTVSRLVM